MDGPPRLQLPVLDASIYETLLERAGALIYVVDRRERILTINRSFRTRADLDLAAVPTLTTLIATLYPDPAFQDNVLLTHQRVLVGAPKREVEWVLTTRQGEQRQVRWQFLLLDQGDDRILIAVGEDVTDRRKLEQWVRLQNSLLTRIPDGIVVSDIEGRVLHWTGASERLLGYPPRSAMERPLANILADTDGKRIVAAWVEELREKGEQDWVATLRREGGSTLECRLRGSRVMNERSQMVGIALLISPLTAQTQVGQFSTDELRIEKLFAQTSAVALVVTDGEGVVRTWGRGAERMASIGASRATGKVLFDEVMRVEGFSWDSLSSRLAARGRFQTRVVIDRPNGGRVPAELDAMSLKEGDAISAVVCVLTDRSEMQGMAEEALQTKMRALPSVFVDGVIRRVQDTCTYFEPDHRFVLARLSELRTLARIVRQGATVKDIDGYIRHSRILDMDKDMDETMYRLGEGVHRLRALVDDIGRFEAGEVDPPGPVRLVREVEAARELVAHAFENRVQLDIRLEDLPPARASRAPLLRGFCLLLLAAAETAGGQEDARVVMEGRVENGWIYVEIKDNGDGFGVDVQSRLPDLAYLAAQPGHAPLFLGLARDSLRTAGGTMEVNTAIGSGTRIRVSFPGADAAVSVQASELPRGHRSPRGKVLLVEEDDLLRRALERHIGETHEVSAFSTIAEALSHTDGCDAAVIAFPRPDGIGLRLLNRFSEVAPSLFRNAIVVVPPGLKLMTREKIVLQGCVVLARPVDLTTLRSLLLRLLPGEELALGEADSEVL